MSFIFILPVIFFISELALLLFRRSKTARSGSDRHSLLFFWVVIPACITAGVMLAKYTAPLSKGPGVIYTGVALVLAGLVIRWLAILQLGKAFTVNVAIAGDQQLKTDGLYGIVRHPSYTGLLMIVAGLACTLNNLYAILAIVLPVVPALAYRIHIEEKLLSESFGESYEQYKKQTRRLIPWIY